MKFCAFPHSPILHRCWGPQWIMKGQETLSFHTWQSGIQRGWAGCPSGGRNQNSRPGVPLHTRPEKSLHGRKLSCSPIFHLYIFIFLVTELSISQGKIWVKIHSPDFQYITFLQDLWLFSPWLEQMLLDYQALFTFFSYLSSIILIQLASLFWGSAFAIWLRVSTQLSLQFLCISVFPLFWVTCFLPKWLFV